MSKIKSKAVQNLFVTAIFSLLFAPVLIFIKPVIEETIGINLDIILNYYTLVLLFFVISCSIPLLIDLPSALKLISGVAKIMFSLFASVLIIYYTIDQKLSSNTVGAGLVIAVYAVLLTSILTMISGYIELLGLKDKTQCEPDEYDAWMKLIKRFGVGMLVSCLFITFSCISLLYIDYYMHAAEERKEYAKILVYLDSMMGIKLGMIALFPWSVVVVDSVIKLFKIVHKGLYSKDLINNPGLKDFVMIVPAIYLAFFWANPMLKEFQFMQDDRCFIIIIAAITIYASIFFNIAVSGLLDKV